MLVRFTGEYVARCQGAKGHRGHGGAGFSMSRLGFGVEVDVPEYSARECPVAVQAGLACYLAAFDGTACPLTDQGRLVGAADLQGLRPAFHNGQTVSFPRDGIVDEVGVRLGKGADIEREKAVAEVRREASKLLLVDGFAWLRCPNPAFVMKDGVPKVAVPLLIEAGTFRLDEPDAFREHLSRAAPWAMDLVPEVDVRVPTALRDEPQVDLLRWTLETAIANLRSVRHRLADRSASDPSGDGEDMLAALMAIGKEVPGCLPPHAGEAMRAWTDVRDMRARADREAELCFGSP